MSQSPEQSYARRERLKAEGTCVVCARIPATRGQKCDRCADRHNARVMTARKRRTVSKAESVENS